MLIDTHCHLDFKDFAEDRDAVLQRAKAAGVTRVINIGITVEQSRTAVELARQYEAVYACLGIHPHYAGSLKKKGCRYITTACFG